MADHLPQCPYSQPCPDEWRNARAIKDEGLPVPHRIVSGSSGRCVECGAGDCICQELSEFGNACAASSYAAALEAARDAVAACRDGYILAIGASPEPPERYWMPKDAALAAIDKLKEE